jgi:hypothetical protein
MKESFDVHDYGHRMELVKGKDCEGKLTTESYRGRIGFEYEKRGVRVSLNPVAD